jgi:hypothetical protein
MYQNYHRMLIEMEVDWSLELLVDERRLPEVKESKLKINGQHTHE